MSTQKRSYEGTVRRRHRRKRIERALYGFRILAALVLAVGALAIDSTTHFAVNTSFLRWNFLIRGPLERPSEVVVVALDEHTLAKHPLPLPRSIITDAVEQLSQYSPKFVLLDLTFSPDDRSREESEALGKTLAKLPAVIGYGVLRDADRSSVFIGNDPLVLAGARREMFLELRTRFGIVTHLTSPATPHPIPYEKVPLIPILEEFLEVKLIVPDHDDLINFYGPPTFLSRVTVEDLLGDPTRSKYSELLKDKVVVFGFQKSRAAALLEHDEELLPVTYSNERMYGVEVHATIAANLLRQDWIRSPHPHFQVAISLVAMFFIGLVQFLLPTRTAFAIVASFTVAGILAVHLLFVYGLIWFTSSAIVFLFALSSLLLVTPFRVFLSKRLHDLIARRLRLVK